MHRQHDGSTRRRRRSTRAVLGLGLTGVLLAIAAPADAGNTAIDCWSNGKAAGCTVTDPDGVFRIQVKTTDGHKVASKVFPGCPTSADISWNGGYLAGYTIVKVKDCPSLGLTD